MTRSNPVAVRRAMAPSMPKAHKSLPDESPSMSTALISGTKPSASSQRVMAGPSRPKLMIHEDPSAKTLGRSLIHCPFAVVRDTGDQPSLIRRERCATFPSSQRMDHKSLAGSVPAVCHCEASVHEDVGAPSWKEPVNGPCS